LENVFRVVLPPGEGAKCVQVGDITIHVVTDTEGPATVAISPDDLIISTTPFPSSARNQFPGRVTSISDAGRGRVALTVDAGIDLVGRITPAALEELGLSLGSPVTLSVKAMAVRVF
jgi:molybdopterin-binding protein